MNISYNDLSFQAREIYRKRNTEEYSASEAYYMANELIEQAIQYEEKQEEDYKEKYRMTPNPKDKKDLEKNIDYHKQNKQELIELRQKITRVTEHINSEQNIERNKDFVEIKTAIENIKNSNENSRENSKLESSFSKEHSKQEQIEKQQLEEQINNLEKFIQTHLKFKRALNPEITKIISEARKQIERQVIVKEQKQEKPEISDSRLETIEEYNRLQEKYEFKTTKNFNPAKAVVKGKEVIEKLINEENKLEQIQKAIEITNKNKYPKTFDMLLKIKDETLKSQRKLNEQLKGTNFEELKKQVEEMQKKEAQEKGHEENLKKYRDISYELEKTKRENPNDKEKIKRLTEQLNSIQGLERNEENQQKFAGEQRFQNEKFDKQINKELENAEKQEKKELEKMAIEQLRKRAIEELGEKGLEQETTMLNGDLRHTGLSSEEKIRVKMEEIKERDKRKQFIKEKQEELLRDMVRSDFSKNNINHEIEKEDLQVKREEIENIVNLSQDEIALKRAQEEGFLKGADLAHLTPPQRDSLEAQKRIDNELLRNLKAFKALKKEYDELKAQERIGYVSEMTMNQYMNESSGVVR